MRPCILCFALLLGCAVEPLPPVTAATDGGSWTVTLDAEWPVGWNDLDLYVQVGADPATGLAIDADTTMPSMGHGSSEPVTSEETGDGHYRVRTFFQMEGPWEVAGTLDGGDGPEGFALLVDVLPE